MIVYVVLGIEKKNEKHVWAAKAFSEFSLAQEWRREHEKQAPDNFYSIYETTLEE